MSALHRLRCQLSTLEEQIDSVRTRIEALSPSPTESHRDWQRGTTADRVELFLRRHSLLAWSPAELVEATACGESSVRSTLTRLVSEGRIERTWHARYQARRRL